MRRPNGHRLRSAPSFCLALAAALGLAAPQALPPRIAWAQAPPAAPAEGRLGQAQLEQMLAPIALYPDPLLTQMLMAATYPMEIVQAARWRGRAENAALTGDALAKALESQAWDPSVKSLVPFPDVLGMMNEQLEWTQALGDAVLAQQDDVFNAIQVLRNRAQAAGKLASGPQQTVNVAQSVTVAPAPGTPPPAVAPPPQVITIEPAQPNTVYVPAYDPSVVYGSWPYPTNPPVYYPPPPSWGVGSALLTGMAFAGGAAIVGSLWGWARPAWGRGYVDVDVNRVNNINVNRAQVSGNRWQHDVNHRQGVAYANQDVRNRYQGSRPDRSQAARDEFRGRVGERPGAGGGLGDRAPGDRPNLGDRGPGDRPNLGDRGPGDRPNLGDRGPGDRPNLGDRGPGDRPNLGDRGPGDRANLGDRTPGDRANLGDRAPGAARPGGGGANLADRTPGAASRPATRPAGEARPTPAQRPAGQAPSGRPAISQQPAARPSGGPQALQGLGQGGDIRAAQQRGQASRQAPVSRPAAMPAAGMQRPAAGAGNFGGGGRAAAGGSYGGGGGRAAAAGNYGGGGGRAGGGGRGGRR